MAIPNKSLQTITDRTRAIQRSTGEPVLSAASTAAAVASGDAKYGVKFGAAMDKLQREQGLNPQMLQQRLRSRAQTIDPQNERSMGRDLDGPEGPTL